jgi:hypothetical protein
MSLGRTICSKHDEIKTISERLVNLLSGQDSVASFTDYEIEELKDVIENSKILQRFLGFLGEESYIIYGLADNAKEDGQSMENGLDTKREKITSLESQISDLEYDAKEREEVLDEAKSRIAYLEALLENTKT